MRILKLLSIFLISLSLISCEDSSNDEPKKIDEKNNSIADNANQSENSDIDWLKKPSSESIADNIQATYETKVNESDKFDVETVINNHLKAIGIDDLLKMKNIILKGKIIQQGISSPFKRIIKRPLKSYFETIIQGNKWINAFDGKTGWYVNPSLDNIPKEATGQTLDLLKEQSDLDGLLYNWKEKVHSVDDLGTATENGKNYYVVLVTKKDGSTMKIFIDKNSMLQNKVTTNVNTDTYKGITETVFSNYKKVNGVQMAFKIEFKLNGMLQTEYVFEEIKANTNVPDSQFSMPGK